MAPRLPFAIAFLAIAAVLVTLASAELSISPSGNLIALNILGSGSITCYVISDTPVSSLTVSSSSLYSVSSITPSSTAGGTNFTVELDLDNGVGSDSITFTADDSSSVSTTVIFAGLDLLDSDGKIVSGQDRSTVVGSEGTYRFAVRTMGIDGSPFDASTVAFSLRTPKEPNLGEVDEQNTKLLSDEFILALSGKTGYGSFAFDFIVADAYDGGVPENVLNVKQEGSTPPCLVKAGEYVIENGKVTIPMYNLLSPPRTSPVSSVVMTVGGETASWITEESDLSNSEQKVVFSAPATGEATFTCDGTPAQVTDGSVVKIVGSSGSSEPLAIDLVQKLEPKEGFAQFSAQLIVKNSSAATFPAAAAVKLVEKCCKVVSGEACALTALVDGSAVCTITSNIPADKAENGKAALEKAFEDCSFPNDLGYDCDGQNSLTLGAMQVNMLGTTVAASSGLSTLMVVVIAGVGALALISLMMVGLLAVYRRSAEQSESDYSSSGPLGVPDPSDLLYEQSIVRDIYGRGDYPDGGPTAEIAADRERQAELREEVPRPPSSNSLSSRASDVSSTYSV